VDRVIAGNDEDIKSVFKWYFSEAVSTKGWPPPDILPPDVNCACHGSHKKWAVAL